MFKKFILCLFSVLISCFFLFSYGCNTTVLESSSESIVSRFVCVEYNLHYYVFVDRYTRVMYFGCEGHYNPILNPDGSYVLYDGVLD